MSVRVEGGVIYLAGRCPAEDAEDLLRALEEDAQATIDISGLQRLHMALMQVLLAVRPVIRGQATAGPLSREIFLRLISDNDTTPKNP
ncbi:hypothetical protein [Novosphingobium sp.]|jgi:hypothetical protein|uniref:hypothetical protein n=1 Tax=Novosphingobium sp. TaxID=1874826 RepID=UPI0031D2711C